MPSFQGFSKEMITFFEGLKKNNKKEWFDAHRKEYEHFVMDPARAFVFDMGEKIRTIVPGIQAIPKVNQSLFRINRDTRFSKDKSPYKTNLGIWFWEGNRKRMECSGFYFHFGQGKLMLGTGMHVFSPELLKAYREAVVHKIHGKRLAKVVSEVSGKGYLIGMKHYKRVPRGLDAAHERSEFLLHNGLTAMKELEIPREFFSDAIIDHAFSSFRDMSPIHEWLKDTLG
ncbi:MAG: DUF2461 domain-containing protein [Desulfatiglandaceae bacterium]